MRRLIRISLTVLTLAVAVRPASAASLDGLQVFSEREYARIVFSLDGEAAAAVEPNSDGKLVLVRFDGTDIGKLPRQSYVFENNSHIESVAFLPLGGGATVARIKVRHPFSLRTYNIGQPSRFVLEVTQSAAAAGGDKGPGPDYYSRGLEQMRQGSTEAALMSFRNAIRAGRQPQESYYQAGLIRLRQNQDQMAEVNFEKAIGSGQYAHEARLFLAWLAHRGGDRDAFRRRWNGFSAAVPDPARRLELAAGHPEVDYRRLESAAREAGLTSVTVASSADSDPVAVSPAVQSVAESSRLNPDSARTCFELGMQDRRDSRYEQAAQHFRRALTFDPSHSEACFQLGIVYKEMGQPEESAAWFERSLGKTASAGDKSARKTPAAAEASLDVEPVSGVVAPPAPGFIDGSERELDPAADEAVAALTAGSRPPADNAGSDNQNNMQSSAATAAPLPTAVAPVTTLQNTGFVQRLRNAVSVFVARTGVALLRKQVNILTLATGILFLLSLVGSRLATGRFSLLPFGSGRGSRAPKPVDSPAPSEPAGVEQVLSLREAAAAVERRKQVAQVLARELAAKQKAIPASASAEPLQAAPAAAGLARAMDLRVGRPGSGPVYGADIARRIKEQLASPAMRSETTVSAGFARARDDVKTRLIRQLRTKNWTISDIAQEMDLSREEVKWALSTGQAERTAPQEEQRRRATAVEFGQARDLALRARGGEPPAAPASPRDLDREMELELQINV